MLEIVRGRPWSVAHTLLDAPDGPASDLRIYTLDESNAGYVKCQIRGKTATRNARGVFELPLVAEVTATLSGATAQILTLSLTRQQVNALAPGDYLIDAVGVAADGSVEALLNPEPLRVVCHPTSP